MGLIVMEVKKGELKIYEEDHKARKKYRGEVKVYISNPMIDKFIDNNSANIVL